MMNSSGVDLDLTHYSDSMQIKFQYYLLMLQMSIEDIIIGLATTDHQNKQIVIISDRGTMDHKAYI